MKHRVNDVLVESEPKIDVSVDRQMQANNIIIKGVEELMKRCEEFNRDIPTQMKIIYEVNTHKLDADISYDSNYTNEKEWSDTFEEWFNEMKTQENRCV